MMERKEAREALRVILHRQKTVSVSKLKNIIDALDIDGCERQRVGQAYKIVKLRDRLRYLETKGRKSWS